MDSVAFDAWLAAIKVMSAEQRRKGAETLASAGADDALNAADVPASSGDTIVTCDDTAYDAIKGAIPNETATVTSPTPPALALVVAASQQRVESVGCPHCGGRRLQRWGGASGLPRYRCGDCQHTFNALTGTPLARLRKKEHWADQAEALMAGESVAKAAERCDVANTTAFRWRHRFLTAPALDKPRRLTGLVEADETFILESFKGKRSGLPRSSRKRGGKAGKRGLSAEQIPVLVARDRTGATTDAVLPKLNRASVTAALAGVVTSTNDLCCDGGKAIISFARDAKIPCHILPSPGGPSSEAPNLHINNVNGYHGRLKEWLRPFHGVATKYLDHYLGWRRAVEALGAAAQPEAWLRGAVGLGPYQQSTL